MRSNILTMASLLFSLSLIATFANPAHCLAIGQGDNPFPSSRPIPPELLSEMASLFVVKERPTTLSAETSLMTGRLEQVIAIGGETLQQYPNASDLYEVRVLMLRGARQIALTYKPTGDAFERARKIANGILAIEAPPQAKLEADRMLLESRIRSPEGTYPPVTEIDIRAFTGRYEASDAQANSLIYGAIIAVLTEQMDLAGELIDRLEANHRSDRNVRSFLRRAGRATGLPFDANLQRLDGGELNLPDDLLGKVVVIDIWATWCARCVESIPQLKQTYAKYKDREVEFVGINLDGPADQEKLIHFLTDKKIDWIQTYSGRGLADPTSREYVTRGIPMILVVGADGIVITDDAGAQLEYFIDFALSQSSQGQTK